MENHRVRGSHALSRARTSLAGLKDGWRRDRALRELWLGLGAGWILLLLLGTDPVWLAVVGVASALALAVEHLNTALEVMLDRLHPQDDARIGAAKDLASGAALLCNFAAGLVIAAAAIVG